MNKPQAGNEFNRVKKSKPNERREKVEAESEKSFQLNENSPSCFRPHRDQQ